MQDQDERDRGFLSQVNEDEALEILLIDAILKKNWDSKDHVCQEVKDIVFEILKSFVDVVCLELKERRVSNLKVFGEYGLFFQYTWS